MPPSWFPITESDNTSMHKNVHILWKTTVHKFRNTYRPFSAWNSNHVTDEVDYKHTQRAAKDLKIADSSEHTIHHSITTSYVFNSAEMMHTVKR